MPEDRDPFARHYDVEDDFAHDLADKGPIVRNETVACGNGQGYGNLRVA